MSISMDTLRGAARLDAQRLQGQGDGQLVTDTRRPGLFSLAAKRDISAANRATAEQIRQALCEHYGRARGESLFAKHIGNKDAGVSSAKLRALLADGDSQMADKAGGLSAALRGRISSLPNVQGGAALTGGPFRGPQGTARCGRAPRRCFRGSWRRKTGCSLLRAPRSPFPA